MYEKIEYFFIGVLCLGIGFGEGNFVFLVFIMEESKEWCLRWMLSEFFVLFVIFIYGRYRER